MAWVQEDPVVCYIYPCFSIIKQYKKIKEDGWVQEDPVVSYFYPCFGIIKQYKKIKEDGWVQEDPVAAGTSRGLSHPQGPLHRPCQGINCSHALFERALFKPLINNK
jgi:hypothetical protein